MKAVIVKKQGDVALIEAPLPVPPAGFARIFVKAAAICATDLEVVDGNIPANYPLIPGHEWSGIVDAVGDPADENWIGKSVIGSSDVVCLKCEACRSGNWRYCKQFEEIGFRRNGAYGEYFLAPVYGLVEKPDHVPFDVAALCEPLGVALGTLKKADAAFGQSLVIYGAGSIGLCMLAAAKAMGLGTTVVIVTHDRNMAKMVERVVSIRDGKTSSEFLVRQDYVQRLQDISGFGEISHEEQTQDEFAVLDRAGRLQLPQDYLERLGLDGGKRVCLSFTDGKVEITAPEKE